MGIFDFFRKKKPVAEPENAPAVKAETTRLCFVLCGSVAPGDLSKANQVVQEIFGRGYSGESSDGQIVSVSRGDESIGFLAHMPAPVPQQEAEENADRNILWSNGKAEAAKHRSHVIVTSVTAGDQEPIEAALLLTRLTLVALKLFNGIGVYWGNASVSNSRAVFESYCEDLSEENLPVPMWLRFQLVVVSDGVIGFYTLGMSQFGLMEVEVDRSKMEIGELFDFVANIATYLIKSGPVIKDGNTVGGSEEERILVRHRPSMIEPERKVYKIVFGG